jgi:manganese transport protein
MEGYLHLRIAPWLRRLATRLIALTPAVLVIYLAGEGATQHLLVLSQVILSLQLSFAVIPLIHFTSNRRNMGAFATPAWAQCLAWMTAGIIATLNGKLVFGQIGDWVAAASAAGRMVGPIPAGWLLAASLYGAAGAVVLLLAWVTMKPVFRPSPAWTPAPRVQLDWVRMLRPRPLATIGVALEHNQADSEILHRALSLAHPGQTELTLLHVVDTPITRVYGSESADRETGADERYLDEVVHGLESMGYTARPVLLHGPNPAAELVARLRREPVDLLVVGSHGHGMVRDLLYGQTVDKVRHSLDIPMLIARPGREDVPLETDASLLSPIRNEPAFFPPATVGAVAARQVQPAD